MDDKNRPVKKTATPLAQTPTSEPKSVESATPTGETTYTMPAKKRFKAWMVIVPVAALLVLAGVIILLVVFLGGPSKKDYVKALDQTKQVRENYRDLSSEIRASMTRLSSSATTDSNAEDITKDLRGALNEYKGAVDTMNNQPALKDKEVRTSYDKLKQKSDGMVAYSDNLLEALPVASKIARNCDGLTRGSSIPSDADFDTCQAALSEGKKLKVEELRKISEARSTFTDKIQDYAKVARKGSESEKSRARSEYVNAQTTYLTVAREQQQHLVELDRKHDVSSEINDLGRLLTRKVNEA